MQVTFTLEHPELSIPAGNSKFSISPDGKYVAIGSTNGSLFLFDIKIGDFVEAYED
jgi:WD40 repeat protein